ncbi:MAG: hypothetical protein ACE37H_11105 [Phycisphaeraceae bacterium]
MADNNPNPTPASATPPRPFFSTPPGLVTGGLLLWVASFAISCFLTVALFQSGETPAGANGVIITYFAYSPPILLAVGGAVMMIIGAVRWAVYGRDSVGAPWTKNQVKLLHSINERLLLSETAKRIAYRHEDIDLLRTTIKTDIDKKDFDAALVLVNEIGTTYGHKEEAEDYREQIIAARTKEMEQKVERALAKLDEVLAKHDFDAATKEALKIQRLYAESPHARDVQRKVAHAREQYKHDLEREFLEAAKVDNVDRAIDLLKELDKYLTEQEAEPFRETARGVIGKKRENLGVQFKIAVHDKEWLRSVAVGEQIIREFPNTRMADEVRGMLDLLRERAAGQRAAQPREGATASQT